MVPLNVSLAIVETPLRRQGMAADSVRKVCESTTSPHASSNDGRPRQNEAAIDVTLDGANVGTTLVWCRRLGIDILTSNYPKNEYLITVKV